MIGAVVMYALPEPSMAGIWSGGTRRMKSTLPAIISAMAVATSGIGRNTSVFTAGCGPQ